MTRRRCADTSIRTGGGTHCRTHSLRISDTKTDKI